MEIEACRPYLEEQIELIDPAVIVTLGNFATKLLLATHAGIRELRGQVFDRAGVLVPTYHPASSSCRRQGHGRDARRPGAGQASDGILPAVSWPLRRTTSSPSATRELAGRLAGICRAGDVVLLVGDLGGGKTVFAQGFAAALGVAGPVTSPTFALVRHYRCGPDAPVAQLIHADVYRTGSVAEVADLRWPSWSKRMPSRWSSGGTWPSPRSARRVLEVTLVVPEPAGAPTRRDIDGGRPGHLGRRAARSMSTGRHARERHSRRASRVRGRPALVAIETATETVGVAVRTPAGVEAEFALTGRRRHVETLTPALEHLLGQVGLVPGDLGAVAVDVGPGLFTGLRVGVAAAKALAQSLGIGVVGATSLDILTAAAVEAGQRGLVLACVDARRGEVFAALRELDPAGAGRGRRAPRPRSVRARGAGGGPAPAGEPVLAVATARSATRTSCRHAGVEVVSPALGFPPPAALLHWPGAASRGRIARRARFRRSPVHA